MKEAFKLDETVKIIRWGKLKKANSNIVTLTIEIDIGNQDLGKGEHAPKGLWALKTGQDWKIVTEENDYIRFNLGHMCEGWSKK